MDEKGIIREALEHYGSTNQVVVAIEELSELQKELCKMLRGKQDAEPIAEEIADVRIMLAQLVELLGLEEEVTIFMDFKLQRLEKRIAKEQAEIRLNGCEV